MAKYEMWTAITRSYSEPQLTGTVFYDIDFPSGNETSNPPWDQLTYRRLDPVKSARQTVRIINCSL
jgi:hypothetical protein